MMPNFWQLATKPILKIYQFPLGMLILRQKSNFVPPAWKLDNPYYHTGYKTLRANLKMSNEKLLAQPESKF